MAAFGKFPSFEAFIQSYQKQRHQEFLTKLRQLPLSLRAARMRQHRDVVEIMGVIQVREPDDLDGDKHYRMRILVREIMETDEHIAADLQRCFNEHASVFIAVRYGDSMGVREQIPGLDAGASLHLRGEWIPRDRAYSHGGEPMSVLHFTHHPLGFICTDKECYS